MRVLTPDQFKKCKSGTVFAYGPRWAFSDLKILDEMIEGDGYWGFWAVSPMWVDSEDFGNAAELLEGMATRGDSRPIDMSSSKFMSYDGDDMDVFIVMERQDWEALAGIVSFEI